MVIQTIRVHTFDVWQCEIYQGSGGVWCVVADRSFGRYSCLGFFGSHQACLDAIKGMGFFS